MLSQIYKFLFIFPLFFCLEATENQDKILAQPQIVSLGCNCQVAIKTKDFNLRNCAYPFDWVVTPSLETVVQCLQDQFQHWLDPNYLEYKGYIKNNYYHISFTHDFPLSVEDPNFHEIPTVHNHFRRNFLDYVPQIQEKYQRRIDRLFALLRSNERVIFIYTEQGNRESANRFIAYIEEEFPQLDFTLVLVNHGHPSYKDIIFEVAEENQSKRLRCFLAYDLCGLFTWWTDKEWLLIFRALGLLP